VIAVVAKLVCEAFVMHDEPAVVTLRVAVEPEQLFIEFWYRVTVAVHVALWGEHVQVEQSRVSWKSL
jgi:hypothetical protein